MNTGPKTNHDGRGDDLPDWAHCELFCIQDYAGTGAARCGWRGRFADARPDTGARLVCPRCGCPSLLRLPPRRAGRREP